MVEVDQLRAEVKSDITAATKDLKDAVVDLKTEMRRGFEEITRQHAQSIETIRKLELRETAHHERMQFISERVKGLEEAKTEMIDSLAKLMADCTARVTKLEDAAQHHDGSSDGVSKKKAALGITISGGAGFFLAKVIEIFQQALR